MNYKMKGSPFYRNFGIGSPLKVAEGTTEEEKTEDPAVTPEAEPVSPPVVAPKDKDITEEFVKKQGVTGKLRRDIARGKTKIMRKADGTLYTYTTKKKQFREHGI